ncbi:MAG: hypothetical protein C4326_10335 [Ignavibacteria bacterium]
MSVAIIIVSDQKANGTISGLRKSPRGVTRRTHANTSAAKPQLFLLVSRGMRDVHAQGVLVLFL